jgi:CRISPR-associated DxTHG motif protein
MAKILLSFIGIGKYELTCYEFAGSLKKDARLAAEILVDVIKPDAIYIIGTAKSVWNIAEEKIGSNNYKPVTIPVGANKEEFWEIFQKITSIKIKKDDEIYVDITHCFRSIPIFAILSIFYFEKIFDIKVKGIYYGMFEGNKEKIHDSKRITKVVDLTPALEIKEWLDGFSTFKHFGDATLISSLLQKSKHKNVVLEDFMSNLNKISNAFGLNYTQDICNLSGTFHKNEKNISDVLEAVGSAPANLIKESLLRELKQFSSKESQNITEIHLKLVSWYRDNKRLTQCIILMGELPITFIAEQLDSSLIFDHKFREKIQKKLILDKDSSLKDLIVAEKWKMIKKISKIRNLSGHGQLRELTGEDLTENPEGFINEYLNALNGFIRNIRVSQHLQGNRERIIQDINNP